MRWMAAGCRVRGLAGEVGQAAVRISQLVKAVKGFTRLDAAAVAEAVDLERSLMETLAMLRSKARERKVRVALSVDEGLPGVRAVGSELNQVWFNLIDNALDAVGEGGSVEIRAHRRADGVCVEVIDDGPGIPAEIRERIFDPFFTTKPVGQGTGLGLDIVRRLVAQQGGHVDLTSAPGRTEFSVRLPVRQADGGGAS
jgi:signal transduction histidine kinase